MSQKFSQTGELKATQLKALESLASGRNVTKTAKLAGVSRETLHRWLAADGEFHAALNLAKREHQAALRTRFITLADKALARVEKEVETGDARFSMDLLRLVGKTILSEPIGATNPGKAIDFLSHTKFFNEVDDDEDDPSIIDDPRGIFEEDHPRSPRCKTHYPGVNLAET